MRSEGKKQKRNLYYTYIVNKWQVLSPMNKQNIRIEKKKPKLMSTSAEKRRKKIPIIFE